MRVCYRYVMTIHGRSRIKMAMCHYCVSEFQLSINNGASAPAKSLRISRWRWVGIPPVVIRGCQISRLSYVDTGLYKVKGKIAAAGDFLYNIEIRTSIVSLERHFSPPRAKGRPWIDSFKRRPRVPGGFSFRNTRARPQGVSS